MAAITGLPASATATLSEDDYLEVGVTAANAEVAEGGNAVFDFALSTGADDGSGATRDTVVTYRLAGDAARGGDYTGHGVAPAQAADTDYTVIFAAGETAAQLSFALADEGAAEADETLSITITGVTTPGGYQTRPDADAATAETTILDTSPALAVTCPAITEGDADLAVACTVTRTRGEFDAETTVNWAVTHDTTTAADFSGATSGSVTFAAGNDSAGFTVTVAGDEVNEDTEHFTAATSGSEAAINHAPAVRVAIADDDRIAVTVTATTAVSEGNNAVVNVNLGSVPSRAITIDYGAGSNGSGLANTAATDDVDASLSGATADLGATTPADGMVTIAADTDPPTATFTIPVTADGLNESAETFQVRTLADDISGAHGTASVAGGGELTFTIAASDAVTVSIAADAARASEGGMAAFTLTLTGASAGSAADITVPYTVVLTGAGYAIADIGGAAGRVTVTAGQTTAALSLALPYDNALGPDDPAQTVTVTLTADDAMTTETDEGPTAGPGAGRVARSATASEQSADVTLNFVGTDPAVFAIAAAPDVAEGDSLAFRVTGRGGAPTGAVTATCTAAGHTEPAAGEDPGSMAAAAGDFRDSAAASTASASFPAPTLTFTAANFAAPQYCIFYTFDDSTDEGREAVQVTLSVAGGGARVDDDADTAIGRIAPSDTARVADIVVTPTGGAVDRDPRTPGWQFNEGDAFEVGLALHGVGASQNFLFQTNAQSACDGASNADFTGSFSCGGSVSSTDFVNFGNPVKRLYALTIADDALPEAQDERVTFTVSPLPADFVALTNYALGRSSVTVTILASDRTLTVTGPASITETDAGVESGDYTVTLTGPAFSTATRVTWAVAHGTTEDADFVDASDREGTLIFGPADGHNTAKTFTLTVAGDTLNEGADAFSVFIRVADPSADGGTTTSGSVTTTIPASDPMTASIARAAGQAETVDEGQSAEFTVTLSGAASGSAAAVAVPYTIAGSGGYTPTDAGGGSVTIAAGQLQGAISVRMPLSGILGAGDDDQTVTVTLTADDAATMDSFEGPTAASGGGEVARTADPAGQFAEVIVNFIDDAHSFTFTDSATTIAEGDDATYTVTRSGSDITSGAALSVTWEYAAGNPAPVAADFPGDVFPAGGVLEFTGSQATKTFTIAIADDSINEPGEVFALTLSIAPEHRVAADDQGGASLPAALSVTITDDDSVMVTIARAAGGGAVNENGGEMEFTITLEGGERAAGVETLVPVSVGGAGITADDFDITGPLTELDGTPPAAGDTAITAILADDRSTYTLTLTATDDDLNEAAEQLTVTGAAPGAAGLRLSNGGGAKYTEGGDSASRPIADDDAISVSVANAGVDADADADGFQVEEEHPAQFTITMDHASSAEARIPWTATGLEAADTTDALSGVAVIAAGDTEATVSFALAGDADAGADEMSEDLTVTLDATGATAAGVIARSATASEQAATQRVIPRFVPTLVLSATGDNGDRDAATPGLQVNEGDRVTITLTIEHPEDLDASFDTAASAFTGEAEPGTDFTGEGGAPDMAFPATTGSLDGVSSRSETWLITDDAAPEGDETVILGVPAVVYAGSGVIVRGDSLRITIQANDGEPARTLTVTGPLIVVESDSDLESDNYIVTLSGRAFATATAVTWTVSHGNTVDADFVGALSGLVTFDAGQSGVTETFTLMVAGDN
ncbi:MAG: hypothetical protein OXU22_09025, partial [Gammaproteobacteria bacterium]|nr:hypothetical protein [Gammaproteobacteria bacterium]